VGISYAVGNIVPAARVKVHAFESSPRTLKILRHNIAVKESIAKGYFPGGSFCLTARGGLDGRSHCQYHYHYL
jgi:hypothetical protein